MQANCEVILEVCAFQYLFCNFSAFWVCYNKPYVELHRYKPTAFKET